MWDNDNHLWLEQDEADARDRAREEALDASREEDELHDRWTDEELAVAQARWAALADAEGDR